MSTRLALAKAGLYAILDTSYVARENLTEKCCALLEGGADLIQLRAKAESTHERRVILEELLPLFSGTDVPLLLNDDLALAATGAASGLHVGQDDTPVPEAREKLGPQQLLGLSTHSLTQATQALTFSPLLDYFAVGPVFATPTKPTYQPVGIDLVRQISARTAGQQRLPWFGIGGINRRTLPDVLAAGAERVVVVSDLLLDRDTRAATLEIKRMLLHWKSPRSERQGNAEWRNST